MTKSNPNIILSRQGPASVASIDRSYRLDEQYLAFTPGDGFVFDPLWDNKHFTRLEINPAVGKLNAHLAFDDDENIIRFSVTVPHELALDFYQSKLVVIHLGDNLWRPMI